MDQPAPDPRAEIERAVGNLETIVSEGYNRAALDTARFNSATAQVRTMLDRYVDRPEIKTRWVARYEVAQAAGICYNVSSSDNVPETEQAKQLLELSLEQNRQYLAKHMIRVYQEILQAAKLNVEVASQNPGPSATYMDKAQVDALLASPDLQGPALFRPEHVLAFLTYNGNGISSITPYTKKNLSQLVGDAQAAPGLDGDQIAILRCHPHAGRISLAYVPQSEAEQF